MGLSWLVGVEVSDVTENWFYSLQFGIRKLCSFILWKLAPLTYGLVLTQHRPLGEAGLCLKISKLASLTLICFPVWVCILCLRPLLCYLDHLYYLSTATLRAWSTRKVLSLLMVYVDLVVCHNWYYATLIQSWRLLFVLVFLTLIRLSFLLSSLFESTLDHQNPVNFIFSYSWYLHNLSVVLWVLWLLSMSYSLGHSLLKCNYSHALEYMVVSWVSSWLMILSYPLFATLVLSSSYTRICTFVEALLILAFISCQTHLDKALWVQGVVRFLPDCADLEQHVYVLGLRH